MSTDVAAVAPPSNPVQVMNAGTLLSSDVIQALAAAVATTAAREQLRRMFTIAGPPLLGSGVAVAGYATDSSLLLTVGAVTAAAVACGVSLAWGVANRALLDQLAVDAAVSRKALAAAVGLARSGVGPSTALRTALAASPPG